ncbi:unnamed protein product [Nezara viridula]|uniref:Uncharacterized protein n=1 Tax=Nezara viridula TaxID=85310 RepID=A0A9P0HCC3_NEZVI|nr:unnamed protein product [Nezara viridula]
MMSEESESVHEEIDDDSFDPEEWIEWFDYYKDHNGDWIHDYSFLEGVTSQFIKDKKESESNTSEETEEDKEGDEEEEEEEEEIDSDEEPRIMDLFESKLQEFTQFAKTYLLSQRNTLLDCNRPYRASNPKFWFYKEFRDYLENQGFMENMVDVIVKMFAKHPELPDCPLSFIRDNYGISQKEEERLIAEWTAVTEEMLMLQDEAKALEKRITWRLKQPREEEDITESDMDKSKSQIRRMSEPKKKKLYDEMLAREEASSSKPSSSFHWVCSDPSSVPSSHSSLRLVGSEISLLPFEEEQEQEGNGTPHYEYDDFKRTEGSSSSLDVGSIELN